MCLTRRYCTHQPGCVSKRASTVLQWASLGPLQLRVQVVATAPLTISAVRAHKRPGPSHSAATGGRARVACMACCPSSLTSCSKRQASIAMPQYHIRGHLHRVSYSLSPAAQLQPAEQVIAYKLQVKAVTVDWLCRVIFQKDMSCSHWMLLPTSASS